MHPMRMVNNVFPTTSFPRAGAASKLCRTYDISQVAKLCHTYDILCVGEGAGVDVATGGLAGSEEGGGEARKRLVFGEGGE